MQRDRYHVMHDYGGLTVQCVPLPRQQKLEACIGCAEIGGEYFCEFVKTQSMNAKAEGECG